MKLFFGIFLLATTFCCSSCRHEQPAGLFELMENTGIDFNNKG